MASATPFLDGLFDALWREYRSRVSYARVYEDLVAKAGGTFRNDHVAFRTVASQKPWSGIAEVARPFEALGYALAGTYRFPDKRLNAVHLAPPRADLPKVFVSEFRAWELPASDRKIIDGITKSARPGLADEHLHELSRADDLASSGKKALTTRLLRYFSRPWAAPERAAILRLEKISQYAAWVMLHGRSVNHFTASVDAHGVASLDTIDKTVATLAAAGVPMKKDVEGAPGSKLRQSSTESVSIPTEMRVRGKRTLSDWTYAYFELAERPRIDGARFEGFLGGQATNLFDMTRRS